LTNQQRKSPDFAPFFGYFGAKSTGNRPIFAGIWHILELHNQYQTAQAPPEGGACAKQVQE
jgi:hypothetical protein